MDIPINSELLLGLSRRICCIGVLIQSAEILANRRELRDDGLLGWAVSGDPAINPLKALVRWLHRYPACLVILAGRAVLALAGLFLSSGSALATGVLALLVLTQLYYNRHCTAIGSDSDTMQLICLGAVFAGSLPGSSPVLRAAALVFLAIQVLIAYFASGFDKVLSPRWRSGDHVPMVFQYSVHRLRPLGAWLGHHPRLTRAATWGVIALELFFPACLVLPDPGFWIYIAGGLAFHATIAFTMGLHGFWWSFTATYPALYYVHAKVSALLYG